MKKIESVNKFLCDTIGHRWDYHLGGAKRSCKRCPVVEWRNFDNSFAGSGVKLGKAYFSL